MRRNEPLIVAIMTALLMVPFFAWGASFNGAFNGAPGGVVGGADACASCPSDADGADLLCEDWESGAIAGDCSFSLAGTTTVYEIATPTPNAGCTDEGGNTLKLTATSAFANNFASVVSTRTYTQLYYNVTSSTIGTGSCVLTARMGEGGGSLWAIYVCDSSGGDTYKYRLEHVDYGTDGTDGITVTTNTAVDKNDGQWYRHNIFFLAETNSQDSIVWEIDGVDVPITDSDTEAGTSNEFQVYTASTAHALVAEMDNIKIDNDTEPPACQ